THFASNPFPKGFLVDFNPKQFSFSKPSKLTDFKLTEVPRTRHLKPINFIESIKLGLSLNAVKSSNSFFHLWAHPFDFASEKEFNFLEKVFKKVNKLGLKKSFLKDV
ncbi:MAG: hypothetical protein ABH821_02420, partial [archaeon]